MPFTSPIFMIFILGVSILYYVLPTKYQLLLLLIASYLFYIPFGVKATILLVLVTLITYLGGFFIDKADDITKKKLFCFVLVSLLVFILGLFKYLNFTFESINLLLNSLNKSVLSNPINLILPVGLSFFIFQAIGYVVDVYRGNIHREKNIIKHALLISYFPKLVSGPIERSNDFLDQLNESKKVNIDNIINGAFIILWGYFQKMVIADRISVIVGEVFENYGEYSGSICFLVAILYSFEIYCDFSGYSCIAIGISKILGISLKVNFRQPYFASSIKDFWRRWHISLSEWFRDYVYIPLGGNRDGRLKKYRNLLVTFLLSGLWHGAGWSFVIWGGAHGLLQVAGDGHKKILAKLSSKRKIINRTITFLLVTILWVFFRMNDAHTSIDLLHHIITDFRLGDFVSQVFDIGWGRLQTIGIFFAIAVLLVVDYLHEKGIVIIDYLRTKHIVLRWGVWYYMILYILVVSVQMYGLENDTTSFIYSQF